MADTVPGSPEIPQPSDAEVAAARKDGAVDAIKESAKESYTFLTDGNLPGDGPGDRWPGKSEIMEFVPLLDYDIEEFTKRINGGQANVSEEKVAGLLGVEKSSRNRTPYVEAMVKRLNIDSVREVTGAGPNYTHDITTTTTSKYH